MSVVKRLAVAGTILLMILVIAAVTVYQDWPTVRANRLVSAAKGSDSVIIYRLQGLDEQSTPEEFPILPYDSVHPTYGYRELSGEDLKGFLDVWKNFPVNPTGGSMCHFPVYGLRFYKKEKLMFQTSLCWACENFYVDTKFFGSNWIGFDSGSEVGRSLLKFCDGLLPYDRGYQERTEKEREAFMKSLK
jgi:hypothetical protein